MKIYGFYFVALINDYREILDNQLTYLLNSELYTKTDKLFLRVFHQNNEDLRYLINKLNSQNKVIIFPTNINEYEFGILELIQKLSFKEDFYCYYLHTKGVSLTETTKGYYNISDLGFLKKNVESWRRYMEYFLIEKYDVCLKHLDEGFDCCGVQLVDNPSFHFSGNFWWSKSNYIKNLPLVNSLDKNFRHNAEFWIGKGKGKMKGLYYTHQASYRTTITENFKAV